MHREARIANYILASLCIVSLTLLSLPLSMPVQAFKTAVSYILNPVAFYGAKGAQRVADAPGRVRDLMSADIENRLMHEEIRQAAWIKAEGEALRVENRRLRSLLGLRPPAEARSAVWARIMERDPVHWHRSVMVDAGASDGATLNAPVLGQTGDSLVAVGRVVEVRPESSVVLLMTDELSSVAAYLSSAAVEGLIQGQGTSRLLMNYLSSEVELSVGDWAFTSPTGSTFPPEVLIGRVSKIFPRDAFLTFQSVEVEPAADASSLKELMILRRPAEDLRPREKGAKAAPVSAPAAAHAPAPVSAATAAAAAEAAAAAAAEAAVSPPEASPPAASQPAPKPAEEGAP